MAMCATLTSAADEPRSLCIIRDMSCGQLDNQRAQINLPASTTALQLMQEVSRRFRYDPDTFELVLQRMCDKETVHVHEHDAETLEELGFRCGGNQRNNLIIGNKNSVPPIKLNVSEVDGTLEENSVSDSEEHSSYVPPPAPPPYTTGSSDFSYSYSYTNALLREEIGFVGLVNQAMTCYLNSFLQTLFMTPEFRNALYKWDFDGTEEEGTKSIPFQLQKLFLQLQTSKKPAVGTTELTTSFGWDSSEAWQQHDVQELCRVMFDALEQKFKNTEQSDLISTLYEGKLKDYVKCLECGYESAREDMFLDVPLVVRPFGSSQAYSSVAEALHAFVTPEILQGSNQYFCEQCNKKCDAHKGLKFTKFPYLLTLQLKRFDFDPMTMHRIKLNNRVSFPEILTLNEFIKSNNVEVSDSGVSCALEEESVCFIKSHNSGPVEKCSPLADDDEGIDVDSHVHPPEHANELCTNERNVINSMEKGPYVYELFSIMVHSGSANGGHYYAYIKSFKLGEWYCFNDAQVTKITYDDIQKTYGGGPSRGYYSSAYSSSTNAYMLMYRQINKEKNTECMSPENFPEHIKDLLQCMQEQEERERLQRELDRSTCKIKLFCQHPTKKRTIEMKLKVHKDCTLKDATSTAHTILGLEGIIPLECCRLVKYDDFHDSLECSFDGCDDEPMGELLGGVKTSYKFELFLEIRKPEDKFQEYKPGGTTVKVHMIDLKNEEVSVHPVTIRSHPSNTVQELEMQISQSLGVAGGKIRIVLEAYSNECKFLDTPLRTLNSEGFRKSNKVFVEFEDSEDAQKPYNGSKLYKVLDRYAHTICIHIAVPKVDKGSLKLYDDVCDEGKYDLSGDDETEVGNENVESAETDMERHSKVRGWVEDSKTQPSPESVKNHNDVPQDYDEGLGDSEMGDSISSPCQGSSQAMYSDQSEDSSLTDSERTLVGDELSPRNNSPDVTGGDMEQDVHDTFKPECDSLLTNSDSSCRMLCQNLSSPEENSQDCRYCKHSDCRRSVCSKQTAMWYFRVYPYTDYETGEKMLRVYVDKRITLAELKTELVSHIGLKADSFKIYRVYSNNQEFECTRLSDNLMSYGDDSRLTIKFGRALRKGEYKVKIYQLCINEADTFKFLIDWVLVKGMTVLKAKKEILPQIKESCGLDIPLNRCRLRKKSWKNPGAIYFDHQKFVKDIPVNSNWEMFFEVLPDAELLSSPEQMTLFTRRWHPAAHKLDPFKEIVLNETNFETLLKKLYDISGIPEDCIEIAKGQGTFPCDVSLLTIHKELEWTLRNVWPFCLEDDSHVLYYRDKREELKMLSEEEKREIYNKENVRTNKNMKNYYSPKKEKALKIYTLDSIPNSTTQTNQNSRNPKMIQSGPAPQVAPDLD